MFRVVSFFVCLGVVVGWVSVVVDRLGWVDVVSGLPGVWWLLVGVLVGVTVLLRPVWRWVGFGVTLVHEVGHVVAGWMVGMRLTGIRVHGDMSGSTDLLGGRYNWVQRFWSVLWGYLFPAVLGAVFVWCVLSGWVLVGLSVFLLLLVVCVLYVRSFVALACFGVGLMVFGGLWWWGSPLVVGVVLFGVGWGLLVGGLYNVWGLYRLHRGGGGAGSDAEVLKRLTLLPVVFWVWFFGVVSLGLFLWSLWGVVGLLF